MNVIYTKYGKTKRKRRALRLPVIAAVLVVALVVAGAAVLYQRRSSPSAVQPKQTPAQQNPQPAPAASETKPLKTYSYCVDLRGVDVSELPEFAEKVDMALNEARGWSLNNKIKFNKVDAGCDFTVWLASPERMTSFGGICDDEWSCMIGDNVIANFDKWQNASPAWREVNGSLDFYRTMVINHEVGHWFGFEHTNCAGEGQIAPVMQQQSVDLQGCIFSPWPNTEERTKLQQLLAI